MVERKIAIQETRNPVWLEQSEAKNHELRLKKIRAECWEDKGFPCQEVRQKFTLPWLATAAFCGEENRLTDRKICPF